MGRRLFDLEKEIKKIVKVIYIIEILWKIINCLVKIILENSICNF